MMAEPVPACSLMTFLMMLLSLCGISQMMGMNPPISPMMPPMEPELPFGCVDSFIDPHLDAWFIAPVDTSNNTEVYSTFDGTCSGEVAFYVTTIRANDFSEAQAICESFGQIASETNYAEEGYPVASDLWYCR